MNIKIITKTFLATLLSVLTTLWVSAAVAAPFKAVYVGTILVDEWTQPLWANAVVGESYQLTIVMDNGGTSAASQTWELADLVSIRFDFNDARDVYFEVDPSEIGDWVEGEDNSAETNEDGTLTSFFENIGGYTETFETDLAGFTGWTAFYINGFEGILYSDAETDDWETQTWMIDEVGPTGWGGVNMTPERWTISAAGPERPDAPRKPVATRGDGQVTVRWSEPYDNGSPITAYTVTAVTLFPTEGSVTSQTCEPTNVDTRICVVTGLTNGTAYTAKVTATNSVGTSDPSPPARPVTPSPGPVPPSTPFAPVATAGDGQASVTWTKPADNGVTIAGYTVTSSGGQTCSTTGADTLTCVVTGLTNGTAYTFTVTANNIVGNSDPSPDSNSVTPGTEPATPDAPVAVAGDGQARVTWTEPADNGPEISGYTVTSSGGQTCEVNGSNSSFCSVDGLTNGTAYTFTVKATNALGTSAASAPSNSVTPAAPASAPDCSDESIDWTTAATEDGWSCTVDGAEYEYSTFLVFTANVAPDSGLPRLKWGYDATKPSESAGTAEEQEGSWIYRVPGGMAINVTDGASQWTDVLQWGNSTVGDASFGSGRALGDGDGAGSLRKISATDTPALASNLEALFSGQRQFTGEGVEGWDTSGVTRMARMFTDAVRFNGNISGWDVSNVAHFASMFVRAGAFNQDISGWETGSVTPEANNDDCFNPKVGDNQCNTNGMGGMFYGAQVFDQDLSGWDVSTYSTTEGAVREVEGTRQIAFGSAKEGRNSVATPFTDNSEWACEKQPQFFEGQCSEPVLVECSDESIDWTTAATEDGWSCTVDGTPYEYADFHVIKKTDDHKDKTCESFKSEEEMPSIKACASGSDGGDVYFYALGTWKAGNSASFRWVDGFTQFGLNFETGQRNQVGDRYRAFQNLGGDGGPAMETLDTSNLTNAQEMFYNSNRFNRDISGWDTSKITKMGGMFLNASAFNQNLAGGDGKDGWDVTKVGDFSNFDRGATSWCGLGFDNRGRPGGWDPSAAVGCLNLKIQAPGSALAGTEVQFVLQYSYATDAEFTGGTLTLELPEGVSVSDGGISDDGTLNESGRTVTWSDLLVSSVPAEQLVTVKIDDGVGDGDKLPTSATLMDGGTLSVNDAQTVTVTQLAMLSTEITATPNVVPGDVIDYTVSVGNSGLAETQGGEVTLTWDSDVPLKIVKGGRKCRSTSNCVFPIDVPAEGRAEDLQLQVRVGEQAPEGSVITASASANATNEAESSESNASARTDVASLPLPELKVDVATQPQGVVDVGAQFTAFVDLSNTGSGPAVSTTVTLDIGSATYVGAAVGNAPSYADNVVTWTVDNLDTAQGEVLSVRLQAPQAEGAVILKSEVSTTAAGNVITDSDSVSLSVTGTAVLDLQLSLNPKDQLLPGDVLDMDFGFQNIGNSPAADAVLATDTPVDTTLLAWPDYATCAGNDCSEGYVGAISLNLGTVLAKENALARLSVVVNETAEEQTLSVAGSLTGKSTAGDALAPQAAAASVRVAAITEDVLAVSQRADRQTVAPGQVVVYEITYQNLSSEAASNVTLTDVLPSETRLLNQTGGTVTIDPDTQETTWQLTTDLLAPLETGKVLLQVEVAGNAVLGTSLNNSVSLSTADSTVWAAPAEVKVVASAAVLESSISNPASTAPGDSFTYALRFANTGTLAASNTTLQLQVEDGVTVTDCDDCSKTEGGRLSWSLSSVAAGTDQTKQITVLVDPSVAANSELHAISYIGDTQNISAGVVGVGAKLQAQQQRRRGGSASATQAASAAERAGPLGVSTIRVGEKASPALGGLKLVAPTQVVAGDPVAVTVSFGNTGGAPATGVTLTSTVPANSTLTSVEGGSCSANPCGPGETITWNVGEVAAESTREVSYSLTADSDADGSVIGHRVVLNSAESREASASANTDVVAEKLSVSIAVKDAAGNDAEGSIVSVGDTLTYELTLLNNSPTDRSGITVVNGVPPAVAACGQACIGGDGKGAAIDAEAGTLTWSNFELDAGAEVTLNYEVTIPSGLANNTPLINSVSVNTATRFDDFVQSTVTVASQAELVLSMTAPGVLQDGAQGGVTLSYQNTGTAATAATLRYVLPSNATMIDSANAAVSGSAYTWNLGDVAEKGAAGSAGSRTVTIEVSGEAGSSLLHTASVTGTDTSDTAEATTVIGLREELALSLSAPGSVNTGAGFTASLTAQNTGNAAATATALSLTLPAGFTASALDGGTLDSALDNEVVRWSVDLAAGASVTLSPTVTAPSAAGKAVLLAGLTATSGKTQSASADVQVTMAPSAIITAGAQFSVPEAGAGDTVTLTAGPVNVGGAASGHVNNTVVLSAGLTATAFDGVSYNEDTRVLSWFTDSLTERGSDLKRFTLQVEDAGALTATVSSNDAEGTASMVRTFPEEVTITPEVPGSSCKLSGQPVVAAAPTPPAGITLSFANTVGFTVIDCDRNPNTSYPEKLTVTIDVGQDIAADAQLYKVSDAGAWAVIEDAVITGQTVTYSITDDGELDQDKTPGTLRDPVALAFPEGEAPPPEVKPVLPVPLPLWLLAALIGSVGWLGYRRLRLA